MKLRLPSKLQARTRIKQWSDRSLLDAIDAGEAGTMGGLKLLIENLRRLAGRHDQIAIQSFEITVDLFIVDDAFNAIDRGSVTPRHQPGVLFSVQSFQINVTSIERGDQVGCCPSCLSTGDLS